MNEEKSKKNMKRPHDNISSPKDFNNRKLSKNCHVVKFKPISDTHIPRGEQDENKCIYNPHDDDLDFQIVDWYSSDVAVEECESIFDNDDQEQNSAWGSKPEFRDYTIRVFGVNDNGHSIACTITERSRRSLS